jgi:uncharacterized protein YxjI
MLVALLRKGGLLRRKGEHATHYKMRQKMVAIGDDFYIENEDGERAFYVDGKALRVRETLVFRDMQGNDLYTIKEKLLHIKDTMDIYRGGEVAATVKKAIISPIRDRWSVRIRDGPDLEVKGNILDHEYSIEEGREQVAQVSKKWFRVRDTYGVEVVPDRDAALVLAITTALDMMAHSGR